MKEKIKSVLQKTTDEIRYMTIKAIGDLGVGHIGRFVALKLATASSQRLQKLCFLTA
jgi:hypothetical protein